VSTIWSPAAVAAIAGRPLPSVPRFDAAALPPLLPGIDLWDLWPVQEEDGRVAAIAGGALYMILSAPAEPDPEARHGKARIRLMHRHADGWSDLGPLLPEGLAPGSREWAGSAVVDRSHCRLTLYFTAAGRQGEAAISFDQRLFETRARLDHQGGLRLDQWTEPVEILHSDGVIYARDMAGGGAVGTIKAFRDPAFFRDPADGRDYLLFSGSAAGSPSPWNGVIGLAERAADGWRLLPPLISADGLNNELERPHMLAKDGLYYLFWSTLAKVFAAGGPSGPNGLYGMVADRLTGPYRPLNGTGLVLANPPEAPLQAYSWLVQHDLSVLSFADLVGLDRAPVDPAEARRHFGGTPAPETRIALSGDRAWPVP